MGTGKAYLMTDITVFDPVCFRNIFRLPPSNSSSRWPSHCRVLPETECCWHFAPCFTTIILSSLEKKHMDWRYTANRTEESPFKLRSHTTNLSHSLGKTRVRRTRLYPVSCYGLPPVQAMPRRLPTITNRINITWTVTIETCGRIWCITFLCPRNRMY